MGTDREEWKERMDKKERCEAEDSGGSVREAKLEGGGTDELFWRENYSFISI
jgi:hypothetical protein